MSTTDQLDGLDELGLDESTKKELRNFILGRLESAADGPLEVHSPSAASETDLKNQLCSEFAPFPDIKLLFNDYDIQFFDGALAAHCDLEWSKKMTLCAGICYYKKHPTKCQLLQASKTLEGVELLMNKYPRCIIRLSEPLLLYRDVTDLKQTLIHEMIHAYCFIFQLEHSRDGHGAVFCRFMQTINNATGLRVTVYHSFHEQVDHARKHIWRCNGVCKTMKPYFGFVKRAMNRPPGPSDWWYARHERECGGTYTKIAGPDVDSRRQKFQDSNQTRLEFSREMATCKNRLQNLAESREECGTDGPPSKRVRFEEGPAKSSVHSPDHTRFCAPTACSDHVVLHPPPIPLMESESCRESIPEAAVKDAVTRLSSTLSDTTNDRPSRATKRPWITLESVVRARNKNIT
eukprot:Gregarina_sp_Poly_1__8260@NODE_481_length_8028_cov_336_122975_g389_i0_p2_GENE_NODE_481_length_8028_cov_336_122975_g389_i0NODE_481_length_8028_cov_336_122975_g389_i0_p2_ORF_typecomplete_len405_score37_45SprTlike/PF10263_9/3_6e25SprTlike/PF10263_9/5_6e03Peptidase_M76/PF09768_9/0_061Peptidase_M76/PF09768_9/6_5e03_NODE_481_length_8028_cov_336_122975_g389_i013612575